MTRPALFLAALLLGLPAHAAPAAAKTAACAIHTGDGDYRGPCHVTWEGGGSFSVRRTGTPGARALVGEITDVSVYVLRPGEAEVRGLVGAINSRWGRATRSRKDPACWVGEDFRVCVR